MDMNRLTQKSQEALFQAQNIAIKYGHQEVDCEHLLLALLRQEQGLIPRILEKMGVNSEALAEKTEQDLNKRPRVSGGGTSKAKSTLPRVFPCLSSMQKKRRNG